MRVRLALAFVLLLALFGWILSRAIAHSTLLQLHYDQAAQQHHIQIALTLFMGILFPGVAIGAWILVGRTLRPLRALSRQASEAPADPLPTRLVSPSSDTEMIEMVKTINGLLERIETTAAAKAQFYGAASHELRTPLQALSGHLETALSQDRDAETYRNALVEAQRQTSRLVTLTHDILLLHQLQEGVSSAEQADVAKSVGVALQELTPLIEARGLTVDVDCPKTLTLPGRQSYADIAIRNLVENASRYAVKGRIKLSLDAKSFEISNPCELEDNVVLEGFFEPFGTRGSGGGNGLGLAVCRAASKANGWTVELSRTEDGVLATVRFSGPSVP